LHAAQHREQAQWVHPEGQHLAWLLLPLNTRAVHASDHDERTWCRLRCVVLPMTKRRCARPNQFAVPPAS